MSEPKGPLGQRLRQRALDVGGMVVAPIATLRSLAARESRALWPPLALYLLALAGAEAKVLLRLGYLFTEGGGVILRRLRDALWEPARTDLVVAAVAAGVLALLARLLSKGRVRPLAAADLAAWLLIPLVLLKALGAALAGFGLELWWLPHHAVDSGVIFVERHVSWSRFLVKCAVAYGPSLVLALAWAATLPRIAAAESAGAPAETPALATWRRRLGVGTVALVMVALLVGTSVGVSRLLSRIRPLLPGDEVPEMALRRLDELGVDSRRIKLESLRGKVVVLDFWASWCTPCRRSIPELSALSTEWRDRGLVVIGVNREPEAPDRAKGALKELKPSFDSVLDDRNYGERLGLTTLPTSFVLDKKGVLRHLHLGYTEIDVLRSEVEALLAE